MLDFCIIGAPKSGTTSLFNWLDAHPALQGASPKEPHFFMDSGHPLCGIHGLNYHVDDASAYSRFFDSGHTQTKRFEATTQYYYQDTAREYLASLQPQPLIIMLLREPADKILSSFRFTRDNLANCDPALTFNYYVDCLLNDNASKLDDFFRAEGSLYIARKELELSRYVEWLDWWLEELQRDRLEPIVFDQLKQEPDIVMTHLSNRLDIDPGFYDGFEFGRDNATYAVGNQAVHRILHPLGARLPGGTVKEYLKRKYLAWQRSKAKPDSGYEDGLKALREYFAPWNKALANRYDLSLDYWWGPVA
jgi:hypothetical protein